MTDESTEFGNKRKVNSVNDDDVKWFEQEIKDSLSGQNSSQQAESSAGFLFEEMIRESSNLLRAILVDDPEKIVKGCADCAGVLLKIAVLSGKSLRKGYVDVDLNLDGDWGNDPPSPPVGLSSIIEEHLDSKRKNPIITGASRIVEESEMTCGECGFFVKNPPDDCPECNCNHPTNPRKNLKPDAMICDAEGIPVKDVLNRILDREAFAEHLTKPRMRCGECKFYVKNADKVNGHLRNCDHPMNPQEDVDPESYSCRAERHFSIEDVQTMFGQDEDVDDLDGDD